MKLILPTPSLETEFMSALDETIKLDPSNLQMMIKHSTVDEVRDDFPTFTEKLLSMSRGENLPEGYVPGSIFWLVNDGAFIGQVSIRHWLTEKLEKVGGHIGYFIRPSMRQKGYGTAALDLAIVEARKLGIKEILVTCNVENTASRKIIEKNGGIYRDTIFIKDDNSKKMRFWINPK